MEEGPIPIRQAAKAVGKSREFVRALVEQGEVQAIVAGGPPDHPRLRVSVAELRAVMVRTMIYVPKAMRGKPQRRRPAPVTHLRTAAAAM